MEGVSRYLLSISAAAIICGIAKATVDEKSAGGAMIRLIAGLIMTFTVISPVVEIDFGDIPALSSGISYDAEVVSEAGKEMALQEINSIISDELEAYILDKAASVGANIRVELRLDGYVPAAVTIHGTVLPAAKQRLQKIFETELGIAKENQQWIQ